MITWSRFGSGFFVLIFLSLALSLAIDYDTFIFRQETEDSWGLEVTLEGHTNWVRDVAWSPVETHTHFTIASCGLVSYITVIYSYT